MRPSAVTFAPVLVVAFLPAGPLRAQISTVPAPSAVTTSSATWAMTPSHTSSPDREPVRRGALGSLRGSPHLAVGAIARADATRGTGTSRAITIEANPVALLYGPAATHRLIDLGYATVRVQGVEWVRVPTRLGSDLGGLVFGTRQALDPTTREPILVLDPMRVAGLFPTSSGERQTRASGPMAAETRDSERQALERLRDALRRRIDLQTGGRDSTEMKNEKLRRTRDDLRQIEFRLDELARASRP